MTVFVAEASSNHDQCLGRALDFVDTAADIGCDAVKFQLFQIDRLFAPEVLAHRPDLAARKAWELPLFHLAPIAKRCHQRGIKFGCTPFYLEAVEELKPYVDFYKVSSYDILRTDLLKACGETKRPVIVSTGMATMDEILQAVLALKDADLTLLHCVSAYPTPLEEANLSRIGTIRRETLCKTGWSDHTRRPSVIERAVHRWRASTVEFHLDIDGEGAEYAQGHCWLPDEIAPVIARIREAEKADHGISPSQAKERLWRADPEDGLRPLRAIR